MFSISLTHLVIGLFFGCRVGEERGLSLYGRPVMVVVIMITVTVTDILIVSILYR